MENKNRNNNSFKLANIIKSFFVPKEMINLTKVPSFLGFVLVILSALLCVFSSRLSSGDLATSQLGLPSIVEELPSDFILKDQDNNEFPLIELTRSDSLGTVKSSSNGVYTNTYKNDNKTLEFIFIIQDDLEEFTSLEQITNFDINGYFNQNKDNNKEYVLYILTKYYLYYAYNLQTTKTEKYYLPNNEEELVINEYNMFDTSLWTKEVEANDQIDFSLTKDENKQLVDLINPTNKVSDDVTTTFSATNFPVLLLMNYGMTITNNNLTFVEYHNSLKSSFIEAYKARYNVLNLLMALVIALIFPPIISLITWFISRQFNLNKYKDYYMICSVCFFDVSLISMFVGFFMQYSVYAFIYLTVASIFYIICIIIINKDQMKFDPRQDILYKNRKTKVVENKESEFTEIG